MLQISCTGSQELVAKTAKKSLKARKTQVSCHRGRKDKYAGLDEDARRNRIWMDTHCVGKVHLNPMDISGPSPDWGARELRPAHAQFLKEEFLARGTVNETIVCVVVHDQWAKDVVAAGDEDRIGSTEYVTAKIQQTPGVVVQNVSGNHSIHAACELQTEYPTNTIWQSIEVKLIICSHSEEDTRQLRIIGNETNANNTIYLKQDFTDMIVQMHIQIEQIESSDLTKTQKRTKFSELKKDISQTMRISPNTVGQHFQLAKQTDPVWSKVRSVLEGGFRVQPHALGFKKKGGKRTKKAAGSDAVAARLTSGRTFVQLPSLPTVTKVHVLDMVLNGEWTDKYMYEQCLAIKARIRLRSHILTYFDLKDVEEEYEEDDEEEGLEAESPRWQGYELQFPWLNSFVANWTAMVASTLVNAELPTDIHDALDEALTNDSQRKVSHISINTDSYTHMTSNLSPAVILLSGTNYCGCGDIRRCSLLYQGYQQHPSRSAQHSWTEHG